jgi:hypothetical protein
VVNKKSAPQKHVVSIDRVGEWGKRVYHHKLECGHVEIRNRASTAPKIACTWCVIGEQKGKEFKIAYAHFTVLLDIRLAEKIAGIDAGIIDI